MGIGSLDANNRVFSLVADAMYGVGKLHGAVSAAMFHTAYPSDTVADTVVKVVLDGIRPRHRRVVIARAMQD